MVTLVFLHGLLGDKSDWKEITEKLLPIPSFCIDLPFHGEAKNINVSDFEDTSNYLAERIQNKLGENPYIIVGYSLGGRLALYYALHSRVQKSQLKGLILEGTNFGLATLEEKQQRWKKDIYWAKRFMQEDSYTILNDWYQQPIFAHLTKNQRENLIKKRTALYNRNISKMLKATSLAKQPDFSEKVRSKLLPIYYIVGEKDNKFRNMILNHHFDSYIVENAGHNSHQENPNKFVEILNTIIADFS